MTKKEIAKKILERTEYISRQVGKNIDKSKSNLSQLYAYRTGFNWLLCNVRELAIQIEEEERG